MIPSARTAPPASTIPALLLTLLLAGLGASLLLGGCGDSAPTGVENQPPQIRDLVVRPESVIPGGETQITALAGDENGDPLTYRWTAAEGSLSDSSLTRVFWTAPLVAGAYFVKVEVSDGTETVADSVQILVGQGSITVITNPPGAGVSLDGVVSAFTAPHTFDEVAIGLHSVSITSNEFVYDGSIEDVYVAHLAADTVRFEVPPASFQILGLGRTDFEEIGGLTYLGNGKGILYAARTTSQGVGIYSSALTPATGQASGVLLTTNVTLDEPLSVSADGTTLYFTGSDGRLYAGTISDFSENGVVDLLDVSPLPLRNSGSYGLTAGEGGRLAFTVTPSTQEAVTQILWGRVENGTLAGATLATSTFGRRPFWQPGGAGLVYQWQGLLLATIVDDFGVQSPDTLDTPLGSYAQMPTWSPWGPRHVAYVNGPDETNGLEVRLQVPSSPYSAPVFNLLFDPRGMAWSPIQRTLAVSHNPPGNPQVLLLFGLPIP